MIYFVDLFCKTLKSGIKKLDLEVLNPFTGARLPVFVYNATEVMEDIYPDGCDSCFILPESSEIHQEISKELGLEIVNVVLESE